MSTQDAHPDPEAQRRWVLFALLSAAARVGVGLGAPLTELVNLLELATFNEARRRGLPVKDVGNHLGVGTRKAAQLSAELKSWFGQGGGAQAASRRVLFALWPGPLTDAKLQSAVGDAPEVLAPVLAELAGQGLIERRPGRTPTWALTRGESRLVGDGWLARIDALGNLAGSVANAVFGRFFRGEPRAFARTLTLRIRPEDLGRLRTLYEEQVWATLRALDEAAAGDAAAIEVDVSMLWAPYAYVERDQGPVAP